jgi:hypothetical protein
VLTFSAIHFIGLAAIKTLTPLPLPIPIWYIFLKNGLWGLSSLAIAIGLFWGLTWAPRMIRWTGAVILVWYWADRILLSRSDFARRAWPAAAILTLAGIGLLCWILSRRSVRSFFRENTS